MKRIDFNSLPRASKYRWIVLGGGGAGIWLASRLADLRCGTVLLVEAGGIAKDVRTRVPAWYPRAQRTSIDWNFLTEPQVGLGRRSLAWPRGRCLGGSSAINALIYMQPAEADLVRWQSLTGRSWKSELLLENASAPLKRPNEPGLACPISHLPLRPVADLHPWCRMFLEAAEEYGLAIQSSWFHAEANVAGAYQLTANQGRRVTLADDLPATSNDNLEVILDSFVHRIAIANGCAGGVELIDPQGNRHSIASEEIILCCGSIGSPVILQRSGVGPADLLTSLGIACHVDLPSVGAHLQDHLVLPLVFEMPHSTGLPRRFSRVDRALYRSQAIGPMSSNLAEVGAMFNWKSEVDSFPSEEFDTVSRRPQFQLHVTPTHYLKYPTLGSTPNCMSLAVTPLHPHSRGLVQIRSLEPNDHLTIDTPKIDPKYLEHLADQQEFLLLADWIPEWMRTSTWRRSGAKLILPNPSRLDSSGLARAVRSLAMTIYHPVGTCRMGGEADSVVDSSFRVRGIERLRIADASVLPELPSGNTFAPSLLVANLAFQEIVASLAGL